MKAEVLIKKLEKLDAQYNDIYYKHEEDTRSKEFERIKKKQKELIGFHSGEVLTISKLTILIVNINKLLGEGE